MQSLTGAEWSIPMAAEVLTDKVISAQRCHCCLIDEAIDLPGVTHTYTRSSVVVLCLTDFKVVNSSRVILLVWNASLEKEL